MFKRAFKMFNRSPAAPTGAVPGHGNGDTPPPLSHPAATAGENDLESALLEATNGGAEVPTLSAYRLSGGGAAKEFKDSMCGTLMPTLVLLALFGVAIFCFVEEVNHIYDGPGIKLDSVVVSSFNVSKASPEARWEIKLSLDLVEGSFKELDLRYEAPRLWVYSREAGGFVSMTSPSLAYSRDGKMLILHALYGVEKNIKKHRVGKGSDPVRIVEEGVEHRVVKVDVVVESNAVHKIGTRLLEVEIKSFVMINCEDLKIEFGRLNKRIGTLVESGKSCGVQVCPIESHALYDGVDECTSSS